jgi:hypothetical protein
MTTGEPLRDAWCYLFSSSRQVKFRHGMQRDEAGRMRIEAIPPGEYETQVTAFGFSVAVRNITIRVGETTEITDVLHEGGALRWVLLYEDGLPVVGAHYDIKADDPDSIEVPRRGVSDATGTCIERGLFPGRYTARAEIPGQEPYMFSFLIVARDLTTQTTIAGKK